MTDARLPILPLLALALLSACTGEKNTPPEPVGPTVDPGPQFPITISRVEGRVYTCRPGQQVPAAVMQLVRQQGETLPTPLATTLRSRGLLGATLKPDAAADLDRTLVGAGAAATVTDTPSAMADVSIVPIRPASTWTSLLDAPTRTDSWALALDQGATQFKPGTLRLFVRAWPAPGEAIPTAGMSATMQVQLLPVVTGPHHEPAPDPLAPPRLSNDLSARGLVLGRQAITLSLTDGQVMVLVAAPVKDSTLPGPAVEAAPLLGQALLGQGPPTLSGTQPAGARVLVIKAVVPGTYRLLLD